MLANGFVAKLLADSGVSSLVSTRVYQDRLPRGFTLPAIVVHQYGGTEDTEFDGVTDVNEGHVQIDVYGKTPAERDGAVAAVVSLLKGFTGTLPDTEGTKVQLCRIERRLRARCH